jgi:hypothetical protein
VDKFDLSSLWKIVNYHVTGSESVYVLSMKLLTMKQTKEAGGYARYAKDFRDMVEELKARTCTVDELFQLLLSTQFIMGLDAEMFSDLLSKIY